MPSASSHSDQPMSANGTSAGDLPAPWFEGSDELQRPEHKQRRQHQPDDPEDRVEQVGLEEGDAARAVHRPVKR
jgi:hypothetical protein